MCTREETQCEGRVSGGTRDVTPMQEGREIQTLLPFSFLQALLLQWQTHTQPL